MLSATGKRESLSLVCVCVRIFAGMMNNFRPWQVEREEMGGLKKKRLTIFHELLRIYVLFISASNLNMVSLFFPTHFLLN